MRTEPTVQQMCEDMISTFGVLWKTTNHEELFKMGYDFLQLQGVTSIEFCEISMATVAVRYSRPLAGDCILHELWFFVHEADGDGDGVVTRHYWTRSEETIA